MKLIDRPRYTTRILSMIDKGLIIALTGQRRVGKSCVMRQVIDTLTHQGGDKNIIYINKDKEEFDALRNHIDLTEYVNSQLDSTKHNYLFIDEVQNIAEFQKSLRSLQADETCSIVITGSNAAMLSGELSTVLGGRYIEYHIQSLDYSEFLQFHNLDNTDTSLRYYLNYGGLPQLYRIGLANEDMIDDYFHSLYNTILVNDVILREKIRNAALLNNLISFISDNIGKPISSNNIAHYLKAQSVDTSVSVIINYLNYFTNAFIINRVPRYDIHGKRLLEVIDKYYFEDIGLRNSLAGRNRTRDIEKIIENVVYLHLKNSGFQVYVGQLRDSEIDFVATKGGQRYFFQVAYLLAHEETIQREFGNLMLIKDQSPKYVISADSLYAGGNDNGIRHIALRNFLSQPFQG